MMKVTKKVGTEFKYYPVNDDYEFDESCDDHFYRIESPVYKKTLYGWIRYFCRKLRGKKDPPMEIVNETLKYHYKPIIIDGLFKEPLLYKKLQEKKKRRTEGE